MTARCTACDAEDPRPRHTIGPWTVVACRRCTFEWVWPAPTREALNAFYDTEQYYEGCAEGYADYLALADEHRRLARQRLERLGGRPGLVLDWGCGAGFFLEEARRRGWQTAALELSSAMRARAALHASQGAFAQAADAAARGPFDLITMWEFIEHCPEPGAVLAQARQMLAPGGRLALSTPNFAHRGARREPPAFPEYKPPAHVCFFDARSIEAVLVRAGFELLLVRHSHPVWSFEGPVHALLTHLRERFGRAGDRRTRLWWLSSLVHRFVAVPAYGGFMVAPSRFAAGLEVHARRR